MTPESLSIFPQKQLPTTFLRVLFLLAPSFLVALMMRKEILSKITKRGGSDANDQDGMSTILEELKRRSSRKTSTKLC